MDTRWLTLANGHPVSGEGWVYVWLWHGQVRYIGATWLDPAVRAELHLHADTDDPRSLMLREAAQSDPDNLAILALAVPEAGDRAAYKTALTQACRRAGALADDAIWPHVDDLTHEPVDEVWLSDALEQVLLASRS